MSQTIWLYCAFAISVVTLAAHIFGGGKSSARPLLDSELDDESKFTNYYCWHMVTIVIAFMAVCFLLAASKIAGRDLAIGATILAGLFALWSIGLTVWKKQKVMTLPQWILFLPIAATGAMGVY